MYFDKGHLFYQKCYEIKNHSTVEDNYTNFSFWKNQMIILNFINHIRLSFLSITIRYHLNFIYEYKKCTRIFYIYHIVIWQ